MSDVQTLKAQPRGRVGKGAARATRREGLVPAVIYGGKLPAEPIALAYKDLHTRLHAGKFLTSVIEIEVDGKKTRVIPRDYQLDPVRDTPTHVDFLRVLEGAIVTVDIPVHFLNQEASPGLKRGGALNIVRHTVEFYCPADKIPSFIEVDLTGLNINDSVHISAVKLPEGLRPVIADRDFTIATIAASAGMKDEPAGEGQT